MHDCLSGLLDSFLLENHKTKEASGAGEGLQLFKTAPPASFVLSLFQTVLDSFLLDNHKTKEASGAGEGLQLFKPAPLASFVLSLFQTVLDGFLLRNHRTKEASGAGEGLQLFKVAPLASFVLSLFQTVLDSFLLENHKTKEASGAKRRVAPRRFQEIQQRASYSIFINHAFITQVQLTGPNRALHLSAADTAACAAAAGQWSAALVTLLAEYKRSIYFPECVSETPSDQSLSRA